MPATNRPNRKPHKHLKLLRKCCDFTQQALAEKIGTSLATIVAVETGTLQMSRKLAVQIMIVTGVHPDSLLGSGPLLSVVNEQPFTPEIYAYFSGAQATAKPGENVLSKIEGQIDLRDEKLRKEVDHISKLLSTLFWAAIKTNQFHILKYLWDMWRVEVLEALKLGEGMKAIAAEADVPIADVPAKYLKFHRRGKTKGG